MLNEVFYNVMAGIVIFFVSACFLHFPQFRGYIVMITTPIVGILAIFLIEPQDRILLWGIAVFAVPLFFLMIYYVFEGSTSRYKLSFAFGHIASILIIWLMCAGVLSYEMGFRAADGEAYRKLQSDFDAYKADSSRAAEIITELEEKLAAQVKIHSEDVTQLGDVMMTLFFINNNSKENLKTYYNNVFNLFQEQDEHDNIIASLLMGYMLDPQHKAFRVKGIKQDADKAIQSYEKAALQGHPYAQYLLGNLYYSVKKDTKQAKKYYQLAADNGHQKAKEMLETINSR